MWLSKKRRAFAALGLLAAGCDPYTRTTVIQMRSAADVAVQDVDSPSRVPVGLEPTSAEVARSEVLVGPGSTSDLIVIATRRPGGEIVTEWQTRLPLLNGERHTLLGAAGMATLRDHVAIDTSSPQITIPVCGTLQAQAVKGRLIGYNVLATQPCNESHMTQINLETPMTNVESIHHVSTNDIRGLGILGLTMSTLILGGIGTLVTFAHFADKDGNLQQPTVGQRVAGIGFMGLGLGIDLALLPAVFAPNKDEVVYPK
ncbi:MAG: hypothetical protein ABI183_21130 [Polyangiaceae bacterium]